MEFTKEQLGWTQEIAAVFALKSPEPREDLAQVAALGLIKALQTYDPARGKLKTYASQKMRGEIQHYLRDKSYGRYPVIPAAVNDRYNLVRNTFGIAQKAGRPETLDEVGIATIGPWQWAEVKRVMAFRQVPLSLDSALEETLGYELGEDADEPLYQAIGELPEMIAIVVRSHFFLNQSLGSIAEQYHLENEDVQAKLDTGLALLEKKLDGSF